MTLLLLAQVTVPLWDLCSLGLRFRFGYNTMLLLQGLDWLVQGLNLFLHRYRIFENEIVCPQALIGFEIALFLLALLG